MAEEIPQIILMPYHVGKSLQLFLFFFTILLRRCSELSKQRTTIKMDFHSLPLGRVASLLATIFV